MALETNVLNQQVPGFVTDDPYAAVPHTCYDSANLHHPRHAGQTGNTVAGNVTNQGLGTVAVGVLAAGAEATITISDTHITATAFIQPWTAFGTTVPAANASVAVVGVANPGTGSVTVRVRNVGSVSTLSTDYVLQYRVLNG